MIEISSRAWHLRLVRTLTPDYTPKSLCGYVLTVVGTAVIAYPVAMAIAVVLVPCGYLFVAALWLWQKRPWRRSQPPAHTEPNLLVEWVKAKKRRICPLIAVKENR